MDGFGYRQSIKDTVFVFGDFCKTKALKFLETITDFTKDTKTVWIGSGTDDCSRASSIIICDGIPQSEHIDHLEVFNQLDCQLNIGALKAAIEHAEDAEIGIIISMPFVNEDGDEAPSTAVDRIINEVINMNKSYRPTKYQALNILENPSEVLTNVEELSNLVKGRCFGQ